MKLSLLTAAFALIAFPSFAQQQQPYVPLDQAQWEAMDRDIHKAPMSEEAHQFVHQVMTAYMRDAQQRAAQAKAREDAAKAEAERKAQEATPK